jgi:hypothetical protein
MRSRLPAARLALRDFRTVDDSAKPNRGRLGETEPVGMMRRARVKYCPLITREGRAMSGPSVQDRYPQAVGAVHEFFTRFYGAQIAESDDAQEELVLFRVGASQKIVAVSADFLEQFGPREIHERLAAWNVAHLSRTLERGCRLLVTSEGPEEERDQ